VWAELIWFRIQTGGGFCEHNNERSVSIKQHIFLSAKRSSASQDGSSPWTLILENK
jgi:hypothetical protein